MRARGTQRARRSATGVVVALACSLSLLLTGCSNGVPGDVDPDQVDSTEPPELGACRVLTPEDVAEPSNATETVDCTEPHTAETFAVGQLPEQFDDASYRNEEVGAFAYKKCTDRFMGFLGADESFVMRTVVSWAWFRPSEKAWDQGARWYRCDIVGGGADSTEYVDLPKTAKALLLGRPADEWMVCAAGETVASEKVPCSEKHQWRAVTTIKLGEPEDPYPGDRLAEVKTRDFCSKSVGAWLNYPVDYDFAYTFFHEAEWEAGNRRSICWARTPD